MGCCYELARLLKPTLKNRHSAARFQHDMLEDRYYMRRPEFDTRRSATLALLVANVVAFVVECLNYGYPPLFHRGDYFALSWEGLRHGYVWQLFTFQFLHGNLLHLLFNGLAIFTIGREMEAALGVKRYLTLYFASGVVGGLFQALGGGLAEAYGRSAWALRFTGPTVGASAGAFGLVAAFALLFPERQILLYFFPVRAKFLLAFEAAFALINICFPGSNIADAAHLGGMLTGIVFIRYAIHWEWHWPRLRRNGRQTPRRLVKVPSGNSAQWRRARSDDGGEMPAEEFLSKEVDPILDKISAHGIQSLTDRERRILEAARQKMSRR